MPESTGMRDVGDHEFEFALTSYSGGFADSTVVNDACGYNAGLHLLTGRLTLPEVPTVDSRSIRISALKPAEDNDGIIIRLWEYRGIDGDATVATPAWCKGIVKTDLMERTPETLRPEKGKVVVTLRPWELSTLKLLV